MIYHCAQLNDVQNNAKATGDHKTEAQIDDRLGFLTPILKGALTELGSEAANLGVQVRTKNVVRFDDFILKNLHFLGVGRPWIHQAESDGADCEGCSDCSCLGGHDRDPGLGFTWPEAHHAEIQTSSPVHQGNQSVLPRTFFFSFFIISCLYIETSFRSAYSALMSSERLEMWNFAVPLLKHTTQWQYLTMKIALGASKNKDWVGSTSVDYLMYSGYVTMGYFWMRMAHVGGILFYLFDVFVWV